MLRVVFIGKFVHNNKNTKMDWIDAYLRFEKKLRNGDVCVCKLDDGSNWNTTGIKLGIYWDGQFYEVQVKEHGNILPHDTWGLWYEDGSSFVNEYAFTGENVEDLISPVLD